MLFAVLPLLRLLVLLELVKPFFNLRNAHVPVLLPSFFNLLYLLQLLPSLLQLLLVFLFPFLDLLVLCAVNRVILLLLVGRLTGLRVVKPHHGVYV